MFQYLLSMLQQPGGQAPAADMFRGMFVPGAENGRMGDYVFSQDGNLLQARKYPMLTHWFQLWIR